MIAAPAPSLLATPAGPMEAAVAGSGPAVLALHGGMGGYDQSWLLAQALLQDTAAYRVIAVSRPGYLGTPLATGASLAGQADALAGLLDALCILDAVVVAVSAGGPFALELAARHPRRCRALILVSACTGRLTVPPSILSRMRSMRALARVPGLPALLRWQAVRNPARAAGRTISDPEVRDRTLADPVAGPLLRALQCSVFDRLARRLPGTVSDTLLFGGLPEEAVPQVRAPVLVVHGTADAIVPFAHAEAVRRTIPGADLLAIEGAGHVALFTHLDRIRKRARPFIVAADAPETPRAAPRPTPELL